MFTTLRNVFYCILLRGVVSFWKVMATIQSYCLIAFYDVAVFLECDDNYKAILVNCVSRCVVLLEVEIRVSLHNIFV